jgi:hypothetical protein
MVAALVFDGQSADPNGTTVTLFQLTIQPHFYFGDQTLEGF